MHIFENTLNFRALPDSKISFRPSKIVAPNHLVDPLTQNILHKWQDKCCNLVETRMQKLQSKSPGQVSFPFFKIAAFF